MTLPPSNDGQHRDRSSTAIGIAVVLLMVGLVALAYATSLRPYVYSSLDSNALRWFGELLIWAPDYLRVILVVCLLLVFAMVVAVLRALTVRLRLLRRKTGAAVRSGLAWAKRR